MEALRTALREMNAAFAQVGNVLRAQGAFGWMYRGDLEQARETLDTLPADVLRQVSAAASVLSTLADELLAERTRP